MDLSQVHEVRRVRGALDKINKVVAKHTVNQLSGIASVDKDLAHAERRLTHLAITNATPDEILQNASRLANLTRTR